MSPLVLSLPHAYIWPPTPVQKLALLPAPICTTHKVSRWVSACQCTKDLWDAHCLHLMVHDNVHEMHDVHDAAATPLRLGIAT